MKSKEENKTMDEHDHDKHGEDMKHENDHQNAHAGHGQHHSHESMFRRRFWISLVLSIPVLIFSPTLQEWLGFSLPEFPGSDWITPAFSIVVFIYGGLPFLRMAIPELRKRKPGMMTLISLAISVAFSYSLATLFIDAGTGFFWELVTLIDVMLLGHWLEMRSVRQASRALDALAQLMPDTAERIHADGEIEEIPLHELKPGDLVLVRPGASIPADGEIKTGTSTVNEAMITGESKPVEKEVGDGVIGGTINGDGSLRIEVTATGDETALAGILRLVKEAQESKSDTQLLADKAAGWLFYAAIAVAAITAIAWILAQGFNVDVVKRVATVLVIACPHALGLAIPLVVAITTSMGASNGILVRNRLALEKSREMDMVIFDKTGTLTRGEFGLVDMAVIPDWEKDKALALAAAVEGDSEHTIARSILAAAKKRGADGFRVTDFEAMKGKGVKALWDGKTVYVGGPQLTASLHISPPEELTTFIDMTRQKGQTIVHLIIEKQWVASFALADGVRPESKQTVERLHEMNVRVAMLTGDSEPVARSVAEQLSIDRYFAEILPQDKDRKVQELQDQGHIVAMVGDGVNDAPALTRADIGIAIGSGTDVAVESAGIILVKSNPLDVIKIIALSRASHRKMIQNLWWAAGYNIIALPLAAGVLAPIGFLLSPAVGALLMSLSTVIVAVNAQTLRRTELG